MKAKELYERVGPALAAKLSRAGGLRGLLDPYCAEYKTCDVPEKVRLLSAICRAGVRVQDLVEAAEDVMRHQGHRPDGSITEGVIALLECASLAINDEEPAARQPVWGHLTLEEARARGLHPAEECDRPDCRCHLGPAKK